MDTIKAIGIELLQIPGVKSFNLTQSKRTRAYSLKLELINKTYLPIVMEQVWSATDGVILKKLIFEF